MARWLEDSEILTMNCNVGSTTYYPIGGHATRADKGVTTNQNGSIFADPFKILVAAGTYVITDELTDGGGNTAQVTYVGEKNEVIADPEEDVQLVVYEFSIGNVFSGTITGSVSGATGTAGSFVNGKVGVIVGVTTLVPTSTNPNFTIEAHNGTAATPGTNGFTFDTDGKNRSIDSIPLGLRTGRGFRVVAATFGGTTDASVIVHYVMKNARGIKT